MKYIDTWDLDSIFPGGTKSKELQAKLHTIKRKKLESMRTLVKSWNVRISKG